MAIPPQKIYVSPRKKEKGVKPKCRYPPLYALLHQQTAIRVYLTVDTTIHRPTVADVDGLSTYATRHYVSCITFTQGWGRCS